MDRKIRHAQVTDSYFDVLPEFHNLTMDAATSFLYGESTDSINGPQYEVRNPGQTVSAGQFAESLKHTLTVITDRLQLGGLYWLVDNKNFRAHVKNCKDFAMYFVQKVLDDPKTYDDQQSQSIFVRELAKETRDPVVIRDQSINVMIAGMDTTASLLSYICYRLARDPRVWAKLRATVLETFGHDPSGVTFESLKRCRYPHYVVNETLRLYPIVGVNFRRAMRDTTIPRGGGSDGTQPVFVPKGTEVLFPVFTMHRDKDLWGDDADTFRPERWEENPIHTWDYLPFGGGPRICIGQQFALTETAYALVRLVQHFDEILPSPEQPEYEPPHRIMLAISAAHGVKVRFASRQ
jgi:cytochrome P450